MKLCELFQKELFELGGNAFKNVVLSRINREDIDATLRYMAQKLNYPGLDYEYFKNNLMGSTGKKTTSGDIDIALNAKEFELGDISNHARKVLGDEYVSYQGVKGGQLNMAWPIAGLPDNGRIQIDFVIGNPEWLKFSHWSPGDKSQYGGVYINTMLGVLSKMMKDYELWPDNADGTNRDDRLARVGLAFDLEKGLHRQWKLQRLKGQGLSKVDPDYWETNVKLPPGETKPPRFARTGMIDNPEAVVDILFPGVKPSQIETFEDLWNVIKKHPKWKGRLSEIKSRFINSVNRSSAIKNTTDGVVGEPEIFKN